MRALVVYASKYGATAGIAERIAATMTAAGVEATAVPAGEVTTVPEDGAVVLGSAVYLGAWLKPAKVFVARQHDALVQRPVWLFSSGPLPGAAVPDQVGEGSPASDPKGIQELVDDLGARGHVVFDGKLDPAQLKGRDRLIRMTPAGKGLLPEVDGRDWDAIDSWARAIVAELSGPSSP